MLVRAKLPFADLALRNLEILASALAKATLWLAVVFNAAAVSGSGGICSCFTQALLVGSDRSHAMVPRVIPSEQPSLPTHTGSNIPRNML